jgi:hypothetical protein
MWADLQGIQNRRIVGPDPQLKLKPADPNRLVEPPI